jgi:AraC-like DNA-binding protein
MVKVFEDNKKNAHFILTSIDRFADNERPHTFRIFWCRSGTFELCIDHEPFTLSSGQILCLAPTQHIDVCTEAEGFAFQYNREFYCLLDHDREVSCIGLLYYGPTPTPVIRLDTQQQRKIELLFQVFEDEFNTHDNIQEEMLRMLLKRLIILCTRWYKEQSEVRYEEEELDTIRQFHVLVEQHFLEKRTVADYAGMMNKSPKTLSNLFSKHKEKPPLRQIHERIALEARRLLLYTNRSIKEISWQLHFEEDAHFSRFFKRLTGFSPTAFRKESQSINLTGKTGKSPGNNA